MSSIVLELQKDLLDKDCDILQALRKAHVIATKLHLNEFDTWIQNELNGYESEDEKFPNYRRMKGTLKAKNPYRGWIPAVITDKNNQAIFNEVDSYANSYKSLEKENQKYKKEVNKLEYENKTLEQENRSLIYRLNELFQLLKKFLRKLLQRGNDYTKDETAEVVKDCYDNSEFDMGDVVRISKGTTKQDELFDYVDAPYYLKERVKDYDEDEYYKDDFDMSR